MIIKKSIPQSRLSSPNIIAIKSKPIVEMTKNGKSLLIRILSTVKVPTNAETPTTANILKMLLPITLPKDIALVPANAEVIESYFYGMVETLEMLETPITPAFETFIQEFAERM